jgi:hypothetical protein
MANVTPQANTWGNPQGTVGNLNGLFKETYADKLQDLIPDQVKIMNLVKFLPKDKQPGNLYHQPVILGMEHGITFASSDEDAFNLQAPVAGTIKDAQIKGCPAVMRSVLGYTAASRAAQGTTQAFEDATKYLVANMLRSMAKKLEIEMLYGQVGYGTVAAGTTPTVITVTTKEWAPGIWAGAENMPIDVRSPDGSVSRGTAFIQSVSFETRTLTLKSAIPGMTANDVIYHLGAYGNEFIGIHAIIAKQTGQLFNIDVSNYNLFRGNVYSAQNAALSFTKLNMATARAVEKGLDGKLTVFVNPRGWANMLNDQAALRKYDQSYSKVKLENGSEALEFHSQNGVLAIVPSVYVKEGYAYMLALEDWKRVGSSDITFKRPGNGTEFFRDLTDSAGYELRLWTDQAVFNSSIGKNVLITDIVNAT